MYSKYICVVYLGYGEATLCFLYIGAASTKQSIFFLGESLSLYLMAYTAYNNS